LIVASRLFKSSKGVPVLPVGLAVSILDSREGFGRPSTGVRVEDWADLRDPDVAKVVIDNFDERGANSDMELRARRKTVCGTTPNFWSSTSPVTLRVFPVSGSEISREEKLNAYKH
jgi:hypothetical protein